MAKGTMVFLSKKGAIWGLRVRTCMPVQPLMVRTMLILLSASLVQALLPGELEAHPLVHYNDTDGAVVHLDYDSLHGAIARGEAWLVKFFIPRGCVLLHTCASRERVCLSLARAVCYAYNFPPIPHSLPRKVLLIACDFRRHLRTLPAKSRSRGTLLTLKWGQLTACSSEHSVVGTASKMCGSCQ